MLFSYLIKLKLSKIINYIGQIINIPLFFLLISHVSRGRYNTFPHLKKK